MVSEASNRPSRTRGRPPKGSSTLSLESIAKAALAEIADGGLTALSVRSVARRLSVDNKSLYHHVDGKDGLLNAVADHLLSTMELPPRTGHLETDLRAFAVTFRSHALKHPEAAILVMTRQTTSTASLIPLDAAMSALLGAGLPTDRAVHLLRLIMAILVGTVLREAETRLTFSATEPAAVDKRRSILLASGRPALMASADEIAKIDNDAEFEHALDAMAHLARSQLQRLGRT
ncbi:TetR/AcrR family transcriptional regulator C-terminal domain-containing protein [Rhodococcus sp. T2V]|uniref:TetR/AcrR family transcriptional regulator C-terminal domain-containing protein n=1 Tax=Rhodococcus sp. T2V TaxID=3034164 RepID=UPI0023E100CA|nr:TetR/AcrR family transcriptional regulator C-terminal domain-containing protein [Rhodococcus sp. T2V]MDF3309705.1 TetR/AcrR family transcriptional regulator C-terminal domain-containing protein [Rhodococcus sp. T2V]